MPKLTHFFLIQNYSRDSVEVSSTQDNIGDVVSYMENTTLIPDFGIGESNDTVSNLT